MPERLWSLERGDARVSATLEDYGINGVEIRINATGESLQFSRFSTRELAMAYADERLKALQAEGWAIR